MNLLDAREAIGAALSTVTGLRVYDFQPQTVNVPCALVMFPDDYEYHFVFDGGSTQRPLIPVRLLVSTASDKAGQRRLGGYIAPEGPYSVKAAIDADTTLGGRVNTATVMGVRAFGYYDVAGDKYLGCEFDIRVVS